jgi:hypothetical protein
MWLTEPEDGGHHSWHQRLLPTEPRVAGELFMIRPFCNIKLNLALIFVLLLAIGEFILQCRNITQN